MAAMWTDTLLFIQTPRRLQTELEGWNISLFIFSSPAYKTKVDTTQLDLLPQGFPSWREKKINQHICVCLSGD